MVEDSWCYQFNIDTLHWEKYYEKIIIIQYSPASPTFDRSHDSRFYVESLAIWKVWLILMG